MFIGKEAVAFLGVGGTYANPIGLLQPGRKEQLQQVLLIVAEAFDKTESHDSFSAPPRNRTGWNIGIGQQVTELELNHAGQTRKRIFFSRSSQALSQAAEAIERLYLQEFGSGFDTSPRLPVFSDSNMVVHWRTHEFTVKYCPYVRGVGVDELNLTLFRDGRYRAEAVRKLWKPIQRDSEIPTVEGQLDREIVEAFRQALIQERAQYADFSWTPMSIERNRVLSNNYSSAKIQQRQRVLYVRFPNGEIHDLSVPVWDEWKRRVPGWSKGLQSLAERITSQVWSRFPPPDPAEIAACMELGPHK
jgi:hypothetical protein